MKALVVVASRHGATAEIAERISKRLSGEGLDVDVRAPGHRFLGDAHRNHDA